MLLARLINASRQTTINLNLPGTLYSGFADVLSHHDHISSRECGGGGELSFGLQGFDLPKCSSHIVAADRGPLKTDEP